MFSTKWASQIRARPPLLDDLQLRGMYRRVCNPVQGGMGFIEHLGAMRRENLHGDDYRRNQKNNCYADPHQGSRTLLVLQGRKMEGPRRGKVRRVNDSITERKKSRKRVAWQRGAEKIGGNGPSRPPGSAWPGLDHRPPEKKAGEKNTSVLQFMNPVRVQCPSGTTSPSTSVVPSCGVSALRFGWSFGLRLDPQARYPLECVQVAHLSCAPEGRNWLAAIASAASERHFCDFGLTIPRCAPAINVDNSRYHQ